MLLTEFAESRFQWVMNFDAFHDFAGLLLPASDSIWRGCSIEHAIEFGGLELAGVVLELCLYGKTCGVEGSPPRIIMPAGCPDQNASHDSPHRTRSTKPPVLSIRWPKMVHGFMTTLMQPSCLARNVL
jgi:hypothetical protein